MQKNRVVLNMLKWSSLRLATGYQHGKDSLFGNCNDNTEVSLRGTLRHSSGWTPWRSNL